MIVLGALTALGVAVAFYEWRNKRVLLKHDLSLDRRPQTEADREALRAADHDAVRAVGATRSIDTSGDGPGHP